MAESDIKVQVTLSPPLDIPLHIAHISPVGYTIHMMSAQPDGHNIDSNAHPFTPIPNMLPWVRIELMPGGNRCWVKIDTDGQDRDKWEEVNGIGEGMGEWIGKTIRDGPVWIEWDKNWYAKIRDGHGEILIPIGRDGYPYRYPAFATSEEQLIRFRCLQDIGFIEATTKTQLNRIINSSLYHNDSNTDLNTTLTTFTITIVSIIPSLLSSFHPHPSLAYYLQYIKYIYEYIIQPIHDLIDNCECKDNQCRVCEGIDRGWFRELMLSVKTGERISRIVDIENAGVEQVSSCYPENAYLGMQTDQIAQVVRALTYHLVHPPTHPHPSPTIITLIKHRSLPLIRTLSEEMDTLYANAGQYMRLLKIAQGMDVGGIVDRLRREYWVGKKGYEIRDVQWIHTFSILNEQRILGRRYSLHYKDKLVCFDEEPLVWILSADGGKREVKLRLIIDGEEQKLGNIKYEQYVSPTEILLVIAFTSHLRKDNYAITLLDIPSICNTPDPIYPIPILHIISMDTPYSLYSPMIVSITHEQIVLYYSMDTGSRYHDSGSAYIIHRIRVVRRDVEGRNSRDYSVQPLLWSMDKDRHRDTVYSSDIKDVIAIRDAVIIVVDKINIGSKKVTAFLAFKSDPKSEAPIALSQIELDNFRRLSKDRQLRHVQKVNDNTDIIFLLNKQPPYNYCMLALRVTTISLLIPPTTLSTLSPIFTNHHCNLSLLSLLNNKHIFIMGGNIHPRILTIDTK